MRTERDRFFTKRITEHPIYTREEELALFAAYKAGDKKAGQKLTCGLGRLVVKMASKMVTAGLEESDLISEGFIGLCQGLEHFDPEKGIRFNTYAMHWVRMKMINAVLRAHAKGRNNRAHRSDNFFKLAKLQNERILFGDEIAFTNAEKTLNCSRERVLTLLGEFEQKEYSLQTPVQQYDVGEYGDTGFFLTIPTFDYHTPETLLEEKQNAECVRNAVSQADLTPREERVLLDRFKEDENTLQEIGQEYGVTRERIRQVQNKALKKVRAALK